MFNYPKIIKNLCINEKLKELASSYEVSFIFKGIIDDKSDVVECYHSDYHKSTMKNAKHNGYVFLPNFQKRQLEELSKSFDSIYEEEKNKRKIIAGTELLLASGLLITGISPLAAVLLTGFVLCDTRDIRRMSKVKKRMDFDLWFARHEEEVTAKISNDKELYSVISDHTKEVLTYANIIPGKITLNNIDLIALNDLKLIRSTIELDEVNNQLKLKKSMKSGM